MSVSPFGVLDWLKCHFDWCVQIERTGSRQESRPLQPSQGSSLFLAAIGQPHMLAASAGPIDRHLTEQCLKSGSAASARGCRKPWRTRKQSSSLQHRAVCTDCVMQRPLLHISRVLKVLVCT